MAPGRLTALRIAVVAAVLVAGALAVVVVLVLAAGGERESRLRQPVRARATAAPTVHQFGDRVVLELELMLDPSVVDPGSVELDPRFDPFTVVAQSRRRTESDGAVLERHRYTLVCLRIACLPGRSPKTFPLGETEVGYRLRGGGSGGLSVAWPRVTGTSRLEAGELAQMLAQAPDRPFRENVTPPSASYRFDPATLAALLFGAALLLVFVAAALVSPELRRLLLLRARRRDPFAGMSPLQRALLLVERSLTHGNADDQRTAIDQLARELRRAGDDELSAAARRLAWSPRAPADADRAPIEEAERTIGASR
jgi:hypothetical protein